MNRETTVTRPGNVPAGDHSAQATASREEIVRLLCAYASESLRSTERWAAAHNINHTDIRAMAELGEAYRNSEPMTAGRLGRALGLSSPATSALIARLESGGHLTRTRDPQDRRRVLLTASPSAQRGAVAYFKPMGDAVTAGLEDCTEEDMRAIARFLSSVVMHMRATPPL